MAVCKVCNEAVHHAKGHHYKQDEAHKKAFGKTHAKLNAHYDNLAKSSFEKALAKKK